MEIEQVAALMQETIRTTLWLALPFLGSAMVVGLFISVLQAATQVNEKTLTFVPKIVVTLGAFALAFPWIMRTLVDFGTRLIGNAAGGGP